MQAYHRWMATWREFSTAAPAFAAVVRAGLESGPYALLGSIRSDGHPRISGVIVTFTDDELWVGMPATSLKTDDLARDPRMSLHSSVSASPTTHGDVKLHGVAIPIGEDDPGFAQYVSAVGRDVPSGMVALFRIDVLDTAQVRLSEARDRHLIESWRSGREGTVTRTDLP